VAEQPVRAGAGIRAKPVADVDGQHDAAVVAARNRLGGNNIAELVEVGPAVVQTVVNSAMTTPVLHSKRQLR
jgi:hypothetical protein